MKDEMRSRERILAAIRCQPVDRIPLGQLFHSTVLNTPADRKWNNQFERARVMKELGIDPTIDIWMPAPEAPPEIPVRKWMEMDDDGTKLLCAYETPAGPDQGPTHRRYWYEYAIPLLPRWGGMAHRDPDDTSYRHAGRLLPRYKVPLVRGPEDLDAFEYLLRAPTGGYREMWIRNALKAKAIALEMGLATQARRVSIGDWFMWVCWIEDFCVQMVENPGYVERFYDIIQNYNRQILDMVLEIQPDVIQYRGWYDTPDYWGPTRLREILAPRIRELASQCMGSSSAIC
jgi:hypothetical protein